jgi:hypothetical protein
MPIGTQRTRTNAQSLAALATRTVQLPLPLLVELRQSAPAIQRRTIAAKLHHTRT